MKKHLILGIVAFTFMACAGTDESQDSVSLARQVEALEKELVTHENPDYAKAEELELKLVKLADEAKDSVKSPAYLYKAAQLAKANPDRGLYAVQYIDRLHSRFPDSKEAPDALFLRGIIWDEHYNDTERAQESMRYLIERFPKHELAKTAREMYDFYADSISIEEKVKQWMKAAEEEQAVELKAEQ